ncbi:MULTISPECIES: alpha/beta fold hydrolase [Burkholderia cepacia complex]|uniref:2-hydroxy-6-ketonona-2,4-dienedioic acid hydrolase n=1 Tax=Burkholderia pseudomultivorans TaxID=1207504 RepID=A0A132EFB2_9BURK|nr:MULTISPECIES: alpha/beta fold hydrolase [Burkholderia cepacia complex]KVH40875.1 2-hydroxy-6-ketonona-2,4-dienedioic acid hydrolase [Burkholderia cepacia]KWF27846.1 2-hydroxy-6-ketonona-2,4-dienedioic acid hydrolase [Burkholderia pseudomultivorans]MBF5010626.1 alpha/beta fold hydrolase [Burkholderia pseudomultivorans]
MDIPSITHAMNQRTVRVGTRRIFLAEAGEGPAVLMLHGGGPGASGLSNYSRNIDALARHYRVLVPDMPGYGRSSKGVDRNDPFGDLATGMLGLLDALGIRHAHVIGNSLGGACALRMALERPNAIDRLVLMGPGGINTTRQVPTPGLKRLLNYYKGTGPSLEKLTTFIRGDLVYDGRLVPEAVIQERFQASIDPEVVASPPLLGPKGIPKFSKIDFTRDPRLASVQNPTLVLWGTEDKVNRASGAEALQRRMPNCDVYLFSKTGHWVQWERADEFNAAVLAFLAQHGEKARVAKTQ